MAFYKFNNKMIFRILFIDMPNCGLNKILNKHNDMFIKIGQLISYIKVHFKTFLVLNFVFILFSIRYDMC